MDSQLYKTKVSKTWGFMTREQLMRRGLCALQAVALPLALVWAVGGLGV